MRLKNSRGYIITATKAPSGDCLPISTPVTSDMQGRSRGIVAAHNSDRATLRHCSAAAGDTVVGRRPRTSCVPVSRSCPRNSLHLVMVQ